MSNRAKQKCRPILKTRVISRRPLTLHISIVFKEIKVIQSDIGNIVVDNVITNNIYVQLNPQMFPICFSLIFNVYICRWSQVVKM